MRPARRGAAALAALVIGQCLFVLLAFALLLARRFEIALTFATTPAAAWAQALG